MSVIANGKSDLYFDNSSKAKAMTWPEPAPVDRLNWLMHIQHVRGEITACKSLIKQEISHSNGKNEYAFFKEGVILREEGKIQEALESFQVCHKLNGESTEYIKEIAKCLYLLRRYRLALEAYLESERACPKTDWEIYHNIGQCLIRLGKSSKAREYVHKAVQCGKQEVSYALLIKILLAENDVRSAIAVCNAAIEICPDSVNMLTESGLLYIKVGQTQQAFEKLSSALALDPTCTKGLLGIGCITQSHEEYDVALSKYKLAVQSQPDSVALWNNIGMCFYSKQKYIAAITCLKRALWLSPLNWQVLFNLGMVHLSTMQPASAFNFLCAAVNLRPDIGLSFMLLGNALMVLNDNENALRAIRQALLLSHDQPLVLLNATVILYGGELYNEARQLMEQFQASMENEKYENGELMAIADRLQGALAQELQEQDNANANVENRGNANDGFPDETPSNLTMTAEEKIPLSQDECAELFGSDIVDHVDKDLSVAAELEADEV